MSGAEADTISRRVRKLVLVAITFMLMIGIAGTASLWFSSRPADRLARVMGPASDGVRNTLTAMLDADAGLRAYVATGEVTYLVPYNKASTEVTASLIRAQATLNDAGFHSYNARFTEVRARLVEWRAFFADPIADMPPAAARKTSLSELDAGTKLFDRFRKADTGLIDELNRDRQGLRDDAIFFRNLGIGSLAMTSIALTGIALMLSLQTARGIVSPIEQLDDVVRRLERGDVTARANEAGPRELRRLGRTVNSMATRAQRDALAEQEAELLSSRIQALTVRMRRVDDPARIASIVTPGLGEAFECDRVWLQTFVDDRVPSLSVQWRRDGLVELPPVLTDEEEGSREAIERLWLTGQPAVIDDHTKYTPSPGGSKAFARLTRAGLMSSIVVALGDATGPFGVVMIGMVAHPREWTRAESATAHAFTADLAHALIQSTLISQQREAVEQLGQLDRAKAAFVSNVTHELRAPLKSITGYVEMLQDGAAGELAPEALEMVEIIDRSAFRLRHLVEDLLTQSRIESGRFHSTSRPVDLGKVLEVAISAMRPQIHDAGLALAINVPDQQLIVDGDEQHLEQVFTNLLSNAVKFTPTGGRITVDAGLEADGVAVSVSDTGIGVPKADLPNLFTRFFRASNAASTSRPGTGLGLAIVEEIVRKHGGEIGVESEQDVGTTFTVWLPSTSDPDDPVSA